MARETEAMKSAGYRGAMAERPTSREAIPGSLGLALQLRGVPRKAYGLVRFRSRGNSVASFTLASPMTFCVKRSRPMANPPCGGHP